MQTDGADRVGDPWEQLLGVPVNGVDPDGDEGLEAALLAYAHRKAARWGAERFADEFRRRDEEDGVAWTIEALAPPVDASVEAQVVEGEPVAFRPEPPRIGFEPLVTMTPDPEPRPLLPAGEPRPPLDRAIEPEPIAPAAVAAAPEPVAPIEVPIEPEPVAPTEVAFEASPAVTPEVAFGSEPVAPPMRHPHVPRPPAPALVAEPQRRTRRGKRGPAEPVRTSVISAPEWARMSPGARRLYGLEEPPGARRAG